MNDSRYINELGRLCWEVYSTWGSVKREPLVELAKCVKSLVYVTKSVELDTKLGKTIRDSIRLMEDKGCRVDLSMVNIGIIGIDIPQLKVVKK